MSRCCSPWGGYLHCVLVVGFGLVGNSLHRLEMRICVRVVWAPTGSLRIGLRTCLRVIFFGAWAFMAHTRVGRLGAAIWPWAFSRPPPALAQTHFRRALGGGFTRLGRRGSSSILYMRPVATPKEHMGCGRRRSCTIPSRTVICLFLLADARATAMSTAILGVCLCVSRCCHSVRFVDSALPLGLFRRVSRRPPFRLFAHPPLGTG